MWCRLAHTSSWEPYESPRRQALCVLSTADTTSEVRIQDPPTQEVKRETQRRPWAHDGHFGVGRGVNRIWRPVKEGVQFLGVCFVRNFGRRCRESPDVSRLAVGTSDRWRPSRQRTETRGCLWGAGPLRRTHPGCNVSDWNIPPPTPYAPSPVSGPREGHDQTDKVQQVGQ